MTATIREFKSRRIRVPSAKNSLYWCSVSPWICARSLPELKEPMHSSIMGIYRNRKMMKVKIR